MNWGSVGELIGKAAPIIGGLVGGPAGGAAGLLVSKVLGCDNTPDAVEQELKTNPEAYAKLKAAQLTHKKELAEIAYKEKELLVKERVASVEAGSQDISNVNKTMQAEAAIGHPWSGAWRPFWGFVSAVAFGVTAFGLLIILGIAVKNKDFTTLSHFPGIIAAVAMLFGIPGSILGVASWHRGQKQRIEAGEVKQPGITGAIANVVGRIGKQ